MLHAFGCKSPIYAPDDGEVGFLREYESLTMSPNRKYVSVFVSVPVSEKDCDVPDDGEAESSKEEKRINENASVSVPDSGKDRNGRDDSEAESSIIEYKRLTLSRKNMDENASVSVPDSGKDRDVSDDCEAESLQKLCRSCFR